MSVACKPVGVALMICDQVITGDEISDEELLVAAEAVGTFNFLDDESENIYQDPEASSLTPQ